MALLQNRKPDFEERTLVRRNIPHRRLLVNLPDFRERQTVRFDFQVFIVQVPCDGAMAASRSRASFK